MGKLVIYHKYLIDNDKTIYLTEFFNCNNNKAIIVAPSLGWYSVGPNRMFTQLAKIAEQNNVNIYSMDYPGQGESYKINQSVEYNQLKESFDLCYKYVKSVNDVVYILGYGIGNYICLEKAKIYKELEGIILYLPYLNDNYKENNVEKKTISIDTNNEQDIIKWRRYIGYGLDVDFNPISRRVIDECNKIDRKKILLEVKCPILIISNIEENYVQTNISVECVREFEKYILAKDWPKNLLPNILRNVNQKILDWVNMVDVKGKKTINNKIVIKNEIIKNEARIILEDYATENEKCLAVVHLPNKADRMPCIILVTGLGGDKMETNLTGPRLGEFFSKRGYCVIRYDSRYAGTSYNDLSEATIEKLSDDLNNVVNCLVLKYSNIIDVNNLFYIGWSEGAKIITVAAQKKDSYPAKSCVFWNPVYVENEGGIKNRNEKSSFVRNVENRKLVKSVNNAGEWFGLEYVLNNKKNNYYIDSLLKYKAKIFIIWSKGDARDKNYEFFLKQDIDESIVDTDKHSFTYDLVEHLFKLSYDWFQMLNDSK